MTLAFTLVRYPQNTLAWSDGWPGLLCGGTDRAPVESALPRSIAEYAAWLAAARVPAPPVDVTFSFSETLDGSDAAGGDVCSTADRAPLPRDELERFLRHAELAAMDLAAAAALPAALLDWEPAGVQLEHADPWARDIRTIRGIVTHALQLEVFYRGSLADGPSPGIFEPTGSVMEEHQRTAVALRAADPGRVYRPSHAGGPPEEWTVRKAMRRLISHHRQHTAEILQRRAWVLLGVPAQR